MDSAPRAGARFRGNNSTRERGRPARINGFLNFNILMRYHCLAYFNILMAVPLPSVLQHTNDGTNAFRTSTYQ